LAPTAGFEPASLFFPDDVAAFLFFFDDVDLDFFDELPFFESDPFESVFLLKDLADFDEDFLPLDFFALRSIRLG
jgi:hypothetical protein